MNLIRSFAVLAIVVMLSPAVFADCPAITQHSCCGGSTWSQYTFTRDCATVSSGVGLGNQWCGVASHVVANVSGTQTVVYQYTIPTTDTDWEIRFDPDFNPGSDSSNFLRADYTITSGGVTGPSVNIFNSGNSAISCSPRSIVNRSFTAGNILTLTVQLRAQGSGAAAYISAPVLFRFH